MKGGALSRQLSRLAAGFAKRPVRLGEVIEVLHVRGYHPLLLFLAAPFVLPFPLPGFSLVLGAVIALLGIRMLRQQDPWVPACLAGRELSPRHAPRVLLGLSRLFRRWEGRLRPRWLYPAFPGAFQRASGGIIAVCGVLLLLPVPVPLSNSFPALTILLLAAAGLQRDGVVFLAGVIQFLLCLGFFGALAFGGAELWQMAFD